MSDTAAGDRVYFRQLLSGRDFARGDMMARQMVNFVYLIGDRETGEAVVVDPAYAVQDLLDIVEADGMRLTGVLGTHFHPDHLGGQMGGWSLEGISTLLEKVQVPVHVQADEVPWVERTTGVSRTDLVGHHSGEVLQVGQVGVELIHTPGHTPGSQCFLVDGKLVAGDTLFLEGCGRTDFPGSDPLAMYESIHTRLARVPDDVILFPGHLYSADPSASMGETRRWNYVFRPRSARRVDGHVRPVTPAGELTEDSTVVVVGASLAGWRAVETLRAEGFEGTISLVGDERHLPYDRPPLSKQVLAGTWPPEKAVLADKRRSSELRVHEVLGRRAVRLDAEGRKVELDDGTVLDGDSNRDRDGRRAAPLPRHRGAQPARRPLHLADPRRLRRPAGGGDGRRVAARRHHRGRVHRRRSGVDLCGARRPRHRARGDGHPAAQRARADDRRALRLVARCQRGGAAHRGGGGGHPQGRD